MFTTYRFWFLLVSLMGLFAFSGCKKEDKISQQGQKCGGKVKCAQGLKCWSGTCEDLSCSSAVCKFVKDASSAIMNAEPKKLLQGLNYEYDLNIISAIPSGGADLYKSFDKGMPERTCKRYLECELPKLGVGYAWYWTRAAYEATKTIPDGAKKVSSDAISVNVRGWEATAIGEDPSQDPEVKINQMSMHRFGCKAEVELKVREDYAGFVTFHFWRKTGCEFIPVQKGAADAKAGFKCQGEEMLTDPKYTYTIYLYPFSSRQLEDQKKLKKDKAKDDQSFVTGNPGTYFPVKVWAYNPIDEATFGEHKQFDDEAEIKNNYPGMAFCPKYQQDPMQNGCGCVGFVDSKITITLDPDPFFMPMDEEKCDKLAEAAAKKE